MITCKECKYWGKVGVGFKAHLCRKGIFKDVLIDEDVEVDKVNIYLSPGLANAHGLGVRMFLPQTGPDFGCIHAEKREQLENANDNL